MKKKVEFLQDYKVAEYPQYGGQIIDAKEGDVEEVSLELIEFLGDKVKDYVESDEKSDDESDEKSDDPDKDPGSGKSIIPDFLKTKKDE